MIPSVTSSGGDALSNRYRLSKAGRLAAAASTCAIGVAFGWLGYRVHMDFGWRMGPLGFDARRFLGNLVGEMILVGLIPGLLIVAIGIARGVHNVVDYRRARRDLCAHCGYQSRSANPCPECGLPPGRRRYPRLRAAFLAVAMGFVIGHVLGAGYAEAQICADEAAFKREYPEGGESGWRSRRVPLGGELMYRGERGYWGTDD
jgi:hypothetical protein